MQTPEQALASYLAARNLKMTPQRRLILREFLQSGSHVSCEDLWARVKAVDGSIGQATVYRTLKLLADSGLANPVDFADGVTRYEPHYGQEHHDHLICEQCRTSIEIVDPVIERRQEALAKRHGFVLSHHRMSLYGLCAACRAKASGS
jgi:Fur family ferric uptake transcriptional regulator